MPVQSKYCNFSFPGKLKSFIAIVVLILLESFTVQKERVLHQIHLLTLMQEILLQICLQLTKRCDSNEKFYRS